MKETEDIAGPEKLEGCNFPLALSDSCSRFIRIDVAIPREVHMHEEMFCQ